MNAQEHMEMMELRAIAQKLAFRLELAKSYLTFSQVKAWEKEAGIPEREKMAPESVPSNQTKLFQS